MAATPSSSGGSKQAAKARRTLLEYALTLPEAWEDHPWGDSVVKVRKKIFLFLGSGEHGGPPSLTVKLPESAQHALSLPEAVPTGYGLGRHGWVTVPLQSSLELLTDWIDESYCAIAPKTLVTKLLAAPSETG
jgi:predicted DNA-binding protein (MmcQ/YjbR family)